MLAAEYPVVVASIASIADREHSAFLLQYVGVPHGVVWVCAEVANFIDIAAIGYAGEVEAACLVNEIELP